MMKSKEEILNVFFEGELLSMAGTYFLKFLKELFDKQEFACFRDFLLSNGEITAGQKETTTLKMSLNRRKPAKTLVTGDKISKVMKYAETNYGRAISVSEAAGTGE